MGSPVQIGVEDQSQLQNIQHCLPKVDLHCKFVVPSKSMKGYMLLQAFKICSGQFKTLSKIEVKCPLGQWVPILVCDLLKTVVIGQGNRDLKIVCETPYPHTKFNIPI